MAKLRDRQNRHVTRETHDAHIVCDCGEVTRTEREAEHQVIECDTCGRGLFVLPAPPQPAGMAKKNTKIKPRATPAPPTEAEKSPANGLTLQTRPRLITPVRVTIVLCIGIVAATGYWLHRRTVRDQAERDWLTHTETGRDLMKAGEFDKARREFEAAVAAAELLGRDDVDVRHAKQMGRECRALADQSNETLFDILTEAEAARGGDWKTQFKRHYAGKWLVLVIDVINDRDGRPALVFPLFIGGRHVRLNSDFEIWESVEIGDQPKRVIIAVQLRSCERDNDGAWVVGFDRTSAFLWTNFDNLLATGLVVAPEARAKVEGEIDTESEMRTLLKSQAVIMGLTE